MYNKLDVINVLKYAEVLYGISLYCNYCIKELL